MEKTKLSRKDFLKLSAITSLAVGFAAKSNLKGLVKTEDTQTSEEEQILPGKCFECHVQCGTLTHIKNGQVIKIEGMPDYVNRGALCAKGQSTVKNLYYPQRINYPMKRTRPKGEADPGWVRISWDEALDTIAAKVKEIQDKYGGRSLATSKGTGRYSNELDTRLKASMGSPNKLAPSHICRGPWSASTLMSVGHSLRGDFANAACQVFWGRNEPWSHGAFSGPGIITNLIEKKSKLIVVDPRFEHPLAHKADIFLPVRPGSDGALFLSFINVIISEELFDKDFVKNWTNGPMLVRRDNMDLLKEGDAVEGGDSRDFLPHPEHLNRTNRPTIMVWDTVTNTAQPVDTPGVDPALFGNYTVNGIDVTPAFQILADRAAEYPPETAAEICWTSSADKIREAARLYANSPSAATDIGSHGYQGIEGGHTNQFGTMRAEICMSAITGNINRPGGDAGRPHWTWITGDWKREGGPRSMSVWGAPEDHLSVVIEGPQPDEPALNEYPLQPGLPSMIDCFRSMVTGQPYPIKGVIMIQGNPLGGWCEDQKIVYEGLKALEFFVDMDLYLTPSNNMADIILPAGLGPFERGKDKLIQALYERRSDEWAYLEIGKRVNPEWWTWPSEEAYWGWVEGVTGKDIGGAKAAGFAIERGAPAPELNYYERIDPQTGKPVGFPTPTGKIEIYSVIAKQHNVDPLPNYVEPIQSPYSDPALAQEFPLVLTSGARLPVYYHSEHRSNPLQRELFPHPEAEIHTSSAKQFNINHGDWIWIETKTGKIRMKAKVTEGLVPGVVSMAHGWWQGCVELGLPGYGWDGANANVLISGDEHDPVLGAPGLRSSLCKVYKADEPPFVWDPPYFVSSVPKESWGPEIYPEAPRQEV